MHCIINRTILVVFNIFPYVFAYRRQETYRGPETEKLIAKANEDNKLGAEKRQSKVKKPPCLRISADSWGIKIRDGEELQKTQGSTQGHGE
jgi:hypothetical protein